MAMTIDECIEIWTHPTQYFPSKREEAVDFAIETMRKYQKIEQILKEPCIIPEGCYPILRKIKREVKE